MRALDLKVLRDLWLLKGQFAAILVVIACGVAVFVGMNGTMSSLKSARSKFYAETRFGHVFAGLERAPEHVAEELRKIPGVQAVQTRVVADVTLNVPDLMEAATGRLISLPDRGRPQANDIRLLRGRLPAHERPEEVVANEAFMEASGFSLGQPVAAILDGKYMSFSIVGVALSPEYTYTVAPGLLFPDDRRFGVFWMRRRSLGHAFDLEGAFNDVSLRLSRTAQIDDVIAAVDRTLADYGGLLAIARKDQQSAFFLENELLQIWSFTFLLPLLFLGVAAFLLNIVFGRLIAGQRGDIAALKAFGYRDLEVAMHYAKLLGVVVLAGWLVGLLLGDFIGTSVTNSYGDYYRLPDLKFRVETLPALIGLSVTLLTSAAGAWTSVSRTVSLTPAEAMRPAAPPIYEPTLIERMGWSALLPTTARIVLRELERKPLRAILSTIGVALATSLVVVMAFTKDSLRHLVNVQFAVGQREDVTLTLSHARSTGSLSGLRALPGVLHAEPYRDVPVEFRSGRRSERGAITGVPRDARLISLFDVEMRDIAVPERGVVMSRKLAELLDVVPGEELEIHILEGSRATETIRVARAVETFVGKAAFMNLDALCEVLGETQTMNSAKLLVDDNALNELHLEVKRLPAIAGVNSRDHVIHKVRELLDENLGTSIFVSVCFALAMAFGVLYNTSRITLAERSRELATLRVLGFRRREVAAILVGELGVVVLLGTPLGLLLGYGLAAALVRSPGFDTEQFRLPLVIATSTYGLAVVATLAAGLVSAASAERRLARFDIVEVLKTRD